MKTYASILWLVLIFFGICIKVNYLGEPSMPVSIKTKFGYVFSGPMSKVQNNEGSTLICHSLKCAAEVSDSDSILQKTIENFSEMESFDLKLITPLFLKVSVRIFVAIQMKQDMKFDCLLKLIIKFCKIILHIACINWVI